MSHLYIYDKQLNDYNKWIKEFTSLLENIEENILQKDNNDKIQEKLMSIGISSVFVSIGSAFTSLFGLVTVGLTGGLALFFIGWVLSKGVNKKVFGEERTFDNLNQQEQEFLMKRTSVKDYFRPIEKKIRIKKLQKEVAFTYYRDIEEILNSFQKNINRYDSSHLALKYRDRHSNVVKKYIILLKKFDKIYKNKQTNGFFS